MCDRMKELISLVCFTYDKKQISHSIKENISPRTTYDMGYIQSSKKVVCRGHTLFFFCMELDGGASL